ncbi:MAG: glycosyl transferase family 36 [Peptococcaceae bacterium]|jgi:cellobiose phosphorylase|nr:glycosyl transferase family 36 [Peptococcaceae bacterium]
MKLAQHSSAVKPVKDILLNRDDLLKHAAEIAQLHLQNPLQGKRHSLLPRVMENLRYLENAHRLMTGYVHEERDVVPSAEWFLDNYYLLKGLKAEILQDLPPKYERQLTALNAGKNQGYPRIYDLMYELLEHIDSRIQENLLRDFTNAYQELIPLTSGEIWAIPMMLKIILLENVRRLAEGILITQEERLAAEKWIQPFEKRGDQPEGWEALLESAPRPLTFTPAFAERLSARIKDFGLDGAPLLRWLERAAAKQDRNLETMIKLEHQWQSGCQASMGNTISGIRFLFDQDWPRFFEEISAVQKILAEDPSGVYLAMDYTSRDVYRHSVEKKARKYHIPEIALAHKVIDLSRSSGDAANAAHIGYYLLGEGQAALENALRVDKGLGKSAPKVHWQAPLYLGGMAAVTAILWFAFWWYGRLSRLTAAPGILLALILLIAVSGIAVTLVNWLVSRLTVPDFLPKLELREGIPDHLRTVVVIPCLLPHAAKVKELFEKLEIYYLANQDPNLHFAVLGDFKDAPAEAMPEDQSVIDQAKAEIQRLRQRYGENCFYFMHRQRTWNAPENCWMGWERKRGKLLEFNRFLREGCPGNYQYREGEPENLAAVKYVITIDGDTQLPRDSAKRLIGALAHPLHAAVLDSGASRISSGYGILQPRIGISIPNAETSFFARVFSGKVGIDPYASAVSDVYQDLFAEGIFTGKGIYDVPVFHQLTKDAFPENRILSHDLIEGLLVRTALVTDIQLLDGFPAKYHADIRRQHRWVRGDWQLLPWMFRSFSAISRWKIGDNLRRSLEAPAQLALILLGFSLLPGNGWVWALPALISVFLPAALYLADQGISRGDHWRDVSPDFLDGAGQALLQVTFLPYKAWVMADAVIRSLTRQTITHKRLLEWESADDTENRLDHSVMTSWKLMGPSVALVWLFYLFLFLTHRSQPPAFTPFLALWSAAPWIARRISQPQNMEQGWENPLAARELRLLSRRLWAYFEEQVTAAENWLPPDNIQLQPPRGTARRTSPTNIGVALLANLSGYDLGYLTLSQTVERVENTLKTMERMERWQGHLYNWYDTQTLAPLLPLYVSTVDSGNLAVYLLTLREGLEELRRQPLLRPQQAWGLYDTCVLLKEAAKEEEWAGLQTFFSLLEELLPPDHAELAEPLKQISVSQWKRLLTAWPAALPPLKGEAGFWLGCLAHMVAALREEIERFQPLTGTEGIPVSGEKDFSGDFRPLAALAADYRQQLENQPEAETDAVLKEALRRLTESLEHIRQLQNRLENFALAMDFRPLYDKNKQLFAIGYKAQDGSMDKSYYDLLASEARQASFFAIAKGDVPQTHWFRLGRSMTRMKGNRCLVSWSGTMFEYLMPLLIMRNFPGTILDETYHSVVNIQRSFGKAKNIPWGISESAFYAFDSQLNYQYKAFGIPGLGLKRGLSDDLVITPYASFLALQVQPGRAMENIQRLKEEGFSGRYGLFEAIDYTGKRLAPEKRFHVVQSFMSHHQGMSLLALTNILCQNHLQECFHAHPLVQATELILQEKLPMKAAINPPPEEHGLIAAPKQEGAEGDSRFVHLKSAVTRVPVTHFLGNGHYSVMITNSGSGFSQQGNIAVSRWRSDFTKENWGMYFYIQNLNSGNVWSATHQPLGFSGKEYQVTCAPDKIEFQRRDGNIQTRLEVAVSPEDQVEIRRLSLTNHSKYQRDLEITSYFEVVLSALKDDDAHPAFNNLFVQTEFTHQALIASRRPRQADQTPLWLMHTVCLQEHETNAEGVLQFETDRFRFIGRGRDLTRPLALELNRPLSNTAGHVLDPIMSLRRKVSLEPSQTVQLTFSTGMARSREEAIHLAEKYQDAAASQRALELAWTYSQMELRHLGLSPLLANTSLSLGGYLVYGNLIQPRQAESIRRNVKGQAGLWAYGVSGDIPVILAKVSQFEHLELIRQLLKIHDYWLQKGLLTDLVILNEDESGYRQNLYDLLRDLTTVGHSRHREEGQGTVHILQKQHLPADDLRLLHAVARLLFSGDAGSLHAQIRKISPLHHPDAALKREQSPDQARSAKKPSPLLPTAPLDAEQETLQFYNGLGGFNQEGTEYIIHLKEDRQTPLPWINIQANKTFGFQISASGGGYTWSGNSRENKLTAWSNDPVLDPLSEVLYLSDREEGTLWTVTPEPLREKEPYTIKYGQGYTVFEHASHGLSQQLTLFVPRQAPVKIVRLQLSDLTGKKRKLAATYYAEIVLGASRELTAPYLVSEYDEANACLLARNLYREEFAGKIVFLKAAGGEALSYTGDRTEFLGRYGDVKRPDGLRRPSLSGNTGAGYDPCLAVQTSFVLEAHASRTLFFFFGEASGKEELAAILTAYQEPEAADGALKEVQEFWRELLQTLHIQTPDKAMDLLVNRWLIYQTTVCRLWARSAFYQAGGAFGYRDQLQDVMAFSVLQPQWTREQILLHSSRQFLEGDVQHWWHPETGKGIRTKFSDDLLWLPYVTLDYLEHTRDVSVLDEITPFLEDSLLEEEEDERYSAPGTSAEMGSVYEHCARAIDRSLRFGAHGLPLMGSGDWNDGLNRVGRAGKGESIWLGWFLLTILERFAHLCFQRQDQARAERYRQTAKELRENIEAHGWDGGWYRRAYFDDGTPLGSADNAECQIDALAQSWAVLAGSEKESRLHDAMLALENYLWRKDDGLLLLLTPPFDKAEPDPGYISGYLPGIRENGGQYTHGAIWTVLAFAARGQGDKALALWQMLNPVNHARTEMEAVRYKAEPYVMAADVYANPQHVGRGGWTWYTGAAGWMYQAAVEGILGFRVQGDQLTLKPCISPDWPEYSLSYQYRSTQYRICVQNPQGKMTGISQLFLDGQPLAGESVPLRDDGLEHRVLAVMG